MKNTKTQLCVERKEEVQELRLLRPDSCWSWLVCAASGITTVLNGGIFGSFGLLLSPLMEDFGVTRFDAAWIGSLHLAFGYLLSPLGSYLSDRYSYRFTSALGNLAGMSGFLLASLSSKLWLMYLTYGFMSGCGHITSYNSCSLVVLQYFIKWRSLAVGIVQSSPAIGVLAVTQLTQAWLDEFGWRWAVRGLAGLYFICALCSAVFVPLDHPSEENNWDKDMIMKPPVEQTRRLSLLGNRPFLILLASVAVNHLANYVPIMHIVKHCEQELHISGNKAATLFTYLALASILSRFLFCKLGDLNCLKRIRLYQCGMTISGLCIMCLPLARSFGSLAVIMLVFGLMEGAMLGQLTLLVLECVGRHKINQAWGVMQCFIGMSVSIGPPLAGFMADRLGSYNPTFYTTGAVMIAGTLITSLMAFVKQQPERTEVLLSIGEELLVTEKVSVV